MTIEIAISESGIPFGVKNIVEQLPTSEQLAEDPEVKVRFEPGHFIYNTSLALLAAWKKTLNTEVSIVIDDGRCNQGVRSLLTNTGFRQIMETGRETPSATRHIGKLPLRPITNRLTVEASVKAVTEIFEEYAGHVEDTSPYTVLISELCENVLAHSESLTPGYICARYLEQPHIVEIALADTGIGVAESYARGSNDSAKERIRLGASPIDIALAGLETSKPSRSDKGYKSYFGFGLYIARRLIEENRGQFLFLSGDEAQFVHMPHATRNFKLSRPWHGTYVALVVDLGNPLPLEEIYDESVKKMVPTPYRISSQLDVQESRQVSKDADLEADSLPLATKDTSEGGSSLSGDTLQIQHFGTQLLTREVGTAIRADLATALLVTDSVVVRLDGVEDMTPSVADEAFAKLAETIGYQQFAKSVTFEGGQTMLNRLVEFVLKTRAARNA